MSEKKVRVPEPPFLTGPVISAEHERIIEWYRTVQFEKKVIGGVDELDLWRKLEELNNMYEAALSAERARCNIMLEQYRRSCVDSIRQAQREAENG